MTESPRQTSEKTYMPLALVKLCSISQLLIELTIAIAVTLLLVGNNIATSPKFDIFEWLSFAWPIMTISIASGALAIAATYSYWHSKKWGIYAHILAVLLQVPLIIYLYWLGIPLVIVIAILVIAIALLALITTLIKLNSNVTIAIIGLGLTFSSFAYQQIGPEIGQYGTECIPIEKCFGPLLGSGFPFQYLIDKPGITGQGRIDVIDDEFRISLFVLDTIFYSAIIWLLYKAVRLFHRRKETMKERAG